MVLTHFSIVKAEMRNDFMSLSPQNQNREITHRHKIEAAHQKQ
jgi:hypothetical protein